MSFKIQPRNNDWNRKYKFMDETATGFLIEIKNGMAHFGWKNANGMVKYYKCEEPVFEKSFSVMEETIVHRMEEGKVIPYLRYPIEN